MFSTAFSFTTSAFVEDSVSSDTAAAFLDLLGRRSDRKLDLQRIDLTRTHHDLVDLGRRKSGSLCHHVVGFKRKILEAVIS
jgi:hypothetical protein